MNKKPIWTSKTAWFGVLTALSPIIAEFFNFNLMAFIQANPLIVSGVWGGLAIALRLITKDKIRLRN